VAVGDVIAGRYTLQELVGAGGMSSVYRAHDDLLDRHVALKILHPTYREDEETVERFRLEAQAVARLSHPNVVTVIDRGEEDGHQFIVFEYVDGVTLKDHLARHGPLPVYEAVGIAIDVGEALAYAHGQGIVHRDVKPQNVIMNGDGAPKVTDFGIARSIDVDKGVTQTGTVVGTGDYIAPEQASGQPVVPASDVYSLGCVLFELLTGTPPFSGAGFVDVAMQHIHAPVPSVRERRADVPPRLAAAVELALAKDPADRFESMDAFVAMLRASLAQPKATAEEAATTVLPRAVPAPPSRTGPAPRRQRRRFPVAPILAGLVIVAGVAALLIFVGDGGGPGLGGASSEKPVKLRAVVSFDPQGDDGEEHPEAVPLATDDSLSTYWPTSSYRAPLAALGKDGVGIVLDARTRAEPKKIVVQSDTPGFTAEIRAGSRQDGPFDDVAAEGKVVGTRTVFDTGDTEARYWLLWITNLGENSSVHITEVKAG
jgi:eukaryotic-like serine/threonine-protein kinase